MNAKGRVIGRFDGQTARPPIVVPRQGRAPRALRVNLATAGPRRKVWSIQVNGCEIFEGRSAGGAVVSHIRVTGMW